MTSLKPDNRALQAIAAIDRTIHSPPRLMVLALLSVVESADFSFVLHQTGLTRGNLSSHMSKLEAAGYIEIEKKFVDKVPRTLLRLTEEGRASIQWYRNNMRQVLDELVA